MKQLIYSVDNSNLDDIISLAKSRTDKHSVSFNKLSYIGHKKFF